MALPGKDLARHFWHLLGGMALPILYVLLDRGQMLMLVGAMVAFALVVEIARKRLGRFNAFLTSRLPIQIKDHEREHLCGSTWVILGSALTVLLFSRPIAILAMSYLAVGDPLAAMVGKTIGRHKILGGGKSLEGSLACLAACVAVGMVLSSGVGIGVALWIVLLGALAATAMELGSFRIDDNLLIPLFSGGAMEVLVRIAGS